MGTFDSVYKNKIRQLEEENQQLRNLISGNYSQLDEDILEKIKNLLAGYGWRDDEQKRRRMKNRETLRYTSPPKYALDDAGNKIPVGLSRKEEDDAEQERMRKAEADFELHKKRHAKLRELAQEYNIPYAGYEGNKEREEQILKKHYERTGRYFNDQFDERGRGLSSQGVPVAESVSPTKRPTMRPGGEMGGGVAYPGKPYRRIESQPSSPWEVLIAQDPGSATPANPPKQSVYDHSTDLHPLNPLRVDDADTGSTHHPGQMPSVSRGFMPDPNEPLVTSQEKKRRELEGTIVRYPQTPKPSLKDILASGMPPPRGGAQVERPTNPYGNIRY